MNRDDIIRMAREAVRLPEPQTPQEEAIERALAPIFERFAALVADAERNKLAAWMMAQGYSTGHGDTVEDLLKELEWQIEDRIKNIIRAKTYAMQNDLAESVEPDSP